MLPKHKIRDDSHTATAAMRMSEVKIELLMAHRDASEQSSHSSDNTDPTATPLLARKMSLCDVCCHCSILAKCAASGCRFHHECGYLMMLGLQTSTLTAFQADVTTCAAQSVCLLDNAVCRRPQSLPYKARSTYRVLISMMTCCL